MNEGEVIASFIVKVSPGNTSEIRERINQIEDVEFHTSEENKLIITIIAPSDSDLYSKYNLVRRIPKVLSVELVFCGFTDDLPDQDSVSGTIPDWLNSNVDASQIRYNGRIPKYFQ